MSSDNPLAVFAVALSAAPKSGQDAITNAIGTVRLPSDWIKAGFRVDIPVTNAASDGSVVRYICLISEAGVLFPFLFTASGQVVRAGESIGVVASPNLGLTLSPY